MKNDTSLFNLNDKTTKNLKKSIINSRTQKLTGTQSQRFKLKWKNKTKSITA